MMKLKNLTIDYEMLAKAKQFYESLGYIYMEVPWIVDIKSALATYPVIEGHFVLNEVYHNGLWSRALVGSGEQGFIDLLRYGELSEQIYDKFMTITPCFRRDTDDETHCQQFMKLELFSLNYNFVDMMRDALKCYKHLGISEDRFLIVNTEYNPPNDDDIIYNRVHTIMNDDIMYMFDEEDKKQSIEVGSYGLRTFKIPKVSDDITFFYSYGTGLALPRFQLTNSTR